jgi:hypothetical protein
VSEASLDIAFAAQDSQGSKGAPCCTSDQGELKPRHKRSNDDQIHEQVFPSRLTGMTTHQGPNWHRTVKYTKIGRYDMQAWCQCFV